MSRKPIFFTSDWHIGHENVLEYSNRPFDDCDAMHKTLVRRFNATVPKDAITYFLGDVGLCKGSMVKEIIDQLNGTKVLILGNHDKGSNAMYALGFDVVLYGATLQICKQRVTLTHCPLLGLYRENTEGMKGCGEGENWHGESRQKRLKFTTHNNGQFHLHGHIHSPNGGKSEKILNRQYDVGVDANNYTPISISVIESWIVNTLKKEMEDES